MKMKSNRYLTYRNDSRLPLDSTGHRGESSFVTDDTLRPPCLQQLQSSMTAYEVSPYSQPIQPKKAWLHPMMETNGQNNRLISAFDLCSESMDCILSPIGYATLPLPPPAPPAGGAVAGTVLRADGADASCTGASLQRAWQGGHSTDEQKQRQKLKPEA